MTELTASSDTLHIVNKAPDHPRFGTFLRALSDTDSVVLIEDAVLACTDPSLRLPKSCVALTADIDARGLQDLQPAPHMISYGDLVRLTEQHEKIISW